MANGFHNHSEGQPSTEGATAQVSLIGFMLVVEAWVQKPKGACLLVDRGYLDRVKGLGHSGGMHHEEHSGHRR